ncbi:TIGR03545 family protein [Arsukibacterium tuosuense]|uniref:TIGR03545 family protein n=1 Tax=Arsukibacterium tuosuense TaxID=1323745 RepID=A0A285IWD4_9GAMM|nr:TIGR03545 family protein [Arsukibacterium tuosuense]SNY52355.1 TIGR03545 family protein [Arsukibacterium tuosuense]
MIRKSGWLIFLTLLAAVLALVYLFLGTAIRLGMVYTLEKAVGAEVNISDVSVSLAPLTLNVSELQITDNAKPSHNTISFSNARAALEVWPALLGYYVINDLAVDGLAYGTERSSPGKVFRGPHADPADKVDFQQLLRLDLPDADELLARADLQTVARGEELQQLAKDQQKVLRDVQSQLPDKAKLEQIQADIKALTDSKIANPADLAAKAAELKKLQDSLRSERDKLKAVQEQLGQSRQQLQQAVTALRDASSSDWQKLQDLANISDGGLAPISQILLGDFWGERIGQLEAVYRLAGPYLPENLPGKELSDQPELTLANRILPLPSQPYPDFWIKNARVNWLIGGGEALVELQDITAQHEIINAATRFNAEVTGLPQLALLKLNGDFAVLEQMVTNVNWQLQGINVDSMDIGRGDTLLQLACATLNTTGKLNLVDNQVKQQAQLVLQQAEFKPSDNKYMQQLATLLNQQAEIPLNLNASGLISAPDVSIRSPLDKLLADAVLGEAKAKIATLQTDLRSKLDSELQQQLGGQSDWLSMLDQQDSAAESLEGNIEQMLNAKLADVKEQAADKLKDKLRDRLGGGG